MTPLPRVLQLTVHKHLAVLAGVMVLRSDADVGFLSVTPAAGHSLSRQVKTNR